MIWKVEIIIALTPDKFIKLRDCANFTRSFLIDKGLDLQDCEQDIFQIIEEDGTKMKNNKI